MLNESWQSWAAKRSEASDLRSPDLKRMFQNVICIFASMFLLGTQIVKAANEMPTATPFCVDRFQYVIGSHCYSSSWSGKE
jgi:hypothetical protein